MTAWELPTGHLPHRLGSAAMETHHVCGKAKTLNQVCLVCFLSVFIYGWSKSQIPCFAKPGSGLVVCRALGICAEERQDEQ